MGWLTTNNETHTLKSKAGKARNDAWSGRGGALCAHCGKPIPGRAGKANYHPKCARKAVSSW
jgi:hypothetical protein